MKQKKLLVLALFTLGLVISCSKDDGPSTPETKAPTISGFTPSSGPVGTPFVINGTNFSTTASKNTVKIGTTTATVTAATATKITTSVPQGASTAKVSVTVGGKTATSTGNFTVTEPQATNKPPTITTTGLSAAEDLQDGGEVGTVAASDDDGDSLTFSMSDDTGIFAMDTATGKISLAEGKTLDFESAPEYMVTVGVADGKGGTDSQDITISVTDVDEAPVMGDQGFEAAEDIADADEIGTVVATDPEGGALVYTVKTDNSGLFEIDDNGVLSLLAGKTLDFETAEEHTITVEVTDGENTVDALITVTVTDVAETLAEDPESFVTTWVTVADNESITIGVRAGFTYNYTIEWGDGTVETITDSNDPTHVYAQAGTHTVAIKGLFPAIRMDNGNLMPADQDKLASIEQWGTNPWATMFRAFAKCFYMEYNATDVPDLSQVTDMSSMFHGAEAFNGDLSGWDVSTVTDMANMFESATLFEGTGLNGWNTSSATDMSFMFGGCESFYANISTWDVSSVTTMQGMFYRTLSFNAPIGEWDVSNVTDMIFMFFQSNFNRSLGTWDLSNVQNLGAMFNSAGLSPANYDATLIGWSGNPNTPDNIEFSAIGVNYCDNFAAAARNNLEFNKGWTIVDDGQNCNP